jgi:hypothetical protein
VLVDSVIGVLQSEGEEIGEDVDEYLVRELEYCEVVVAGQPCVDSERVCGALLRLV